MVFAFACLSFSKIPNEPFLLKRSGNNPSFPARPLRTELKIKPTKFSCTDICWVVVESHSQQLFLTASSPNEDDVTLMEGGGRYALPGFLIPVFVSSRKARLLPVVFYIYIYIFLSQIIAL